MKQSSGEAPAHHGEVATVTKYSNQTAGPGRPLPAVRQPVQAGAGRWTLRVGAIAMALGIGIGAGSAAWGLGAQSQDFPVPESSIALPRSSIDRSPLQAMEQDVQRRLANLERGKKMRSDTQRMVALALRVKQALDSRGRNQSREGTARQVAEIERLAHDVQERMAGR